MDLVPPRAMRIRHLALLAMVGFVLATASCDSVTNPSAESGELPDISGTWVLEGTGFPRGTDTSEGQCKFGPVIVELTASRAPGALAEYTGSHSGYSLACFGFTDLGSEASGWTDTTLIFSADSVAAFVSAICGTLPNCGGPVDATASFRIPGELGLSGLADELDMTGDLVFISEDTVRLNGSWSGRR
jgi:hypothetical protein